MILPYDASKEERDRVVKERQAKMAAAFERMRAKIDDQTSEMNMSTVSERVRRQQLEEIRNELQKSLGTFYSDLEDGLKSDMVTVGSSVLNESEGFYSALNMPIAASITSFPVEIMANIVNGTVYEQKWYLSNALWGDYQSKLDDINEVITQGIGLNLSTLEIAKNLEKYVDPQTMKPSQSIQTPCYKDPETGKLYSENYAKRHPEKDWSNFEKVTSTFRFGKVDYNAQRLARTLINHAYQQNVVHQAKANPFSKGVKWLASGGERMCEICEERDGKIFDPDDIPLDHPNGMCTFEVVTELGMMEMSDVLADFVNGEPTEYDAKLYAWYNDRAEVPIERPENGFAKRLVVEGTDISATWQRRPDEFAFEIEDVMNAQGFDGLPQIVSKEEFDRLVKEANDGNGFIAQRTYSAGDQETLDAYRDMLYNGKWYVDCGTGGAQYGQGMYCAADYTGKLSDGIKIEMGHYGQLGRNRCGGNALSEAVGRLKIEVIYDKNGNLIPIDQAKAIRDMTIDEFVKNFSNKFPELKELHDAVSYTETLTLDKSARIISYNDLTFELNKYISDRKQYWSEEIDKTDEFDFDKMQKVKADRDAELKYLRNMNVGSFAVLKGYDVINAEGHGESGSYTVVLNRTKLIIQEP